MAVTLLNGFDLQDIRVEGWTPAGTTQPTASTAQFRTGTASARCNPGSGVSGYFAGKTVTLGQYIHFGLYIASMPSVQRVIAGITQAGTLTVRLESNGTLSVYLNTTLVGTSSVALTTGQWYWIGYRELTGTSVVFLQIDGVDQVTGTATVTTGSNGSFGCRGTEASAIDIYIDDVIVDGAGFLQPSKVDVALPISDNTVTGVTDNNGVTTNIWQCVDNTPPTGVASANEAANPKAGMHFTASVTCNYIANLETYTTLGILAADTVLAVQSIVRQGEDIATGTKTMQNVGALTNPTVAGASITVAGDVGAHAAESGIWTNTFGTVTTGPSVTLGTNPTIRASRVSESRLACVDLMCMYVAWTPVVVDRPYTSPYRQIIPQ